MATTYLVPGINSMLSIPYPSLRIPMAKNVSKRLPAAIINKITTNAQNALPSPEGSSGCFTVSNSLKI